MPWRVRFYKLTGHKFDAGIEAAFGPGVLACGDDYSVEPLEKFTVPADDVDIAVFLGVKNNTRDVFNSYLDAGKHAVIWDKGYTRIRGGPLKTLYWRSSVDCFQPHRYLFDQPFKNDRWDKLGIRIKPMQKVKPEQRILFCGGSQKYCDWHELGDATEYARWVLRKARKYTRRPLAYRPKPGWQGAVPIDGATFATGEYGSFGKELKNTFQVVVFGSNAAFESLICGVPVTVLGDGIVRSLARTSLRDLDTPLYPVEADVHRLACAAAYCQWTMAEMSSGVAWNYLREIPQKMEEGEYEEEKEKA